MDTGKIKAFAIAARTQLMAEVKARFDIVLAPSSSARVEAPESIRALERSIHGQGGGEAGRDLVAEQVAYTWFNRIVALRFMDVKGYTGSSVVSSQRGMENGQPEILADAKRGHFDADVVDTRTVSNVTALLNGSRKSSDPQGEAYGLLLTAYCRHWNESMPYMFQTKGDYTELLMPADLLAEGSVLSKAVRTLSKDDCIDVEVIGWLYQFYIAERKQQVFNGFTNKQNAIKAGPAEIPAATQLFTPHWIVRYLVENTLGRLWLLNRPDSKLADQMEYYVPPIDDESDFLRVTSPEELKVLDPACGSGHLLTYAFDLLYAIYEEEGYSPSEIPSLILHRNLYGTEIDERAGALAAFALTMKARAKQRRFFDQHVEPNICVVRPIHFDQNELVELTVPGVVRPDEERFWNQFEHADTIGSLVFPNEELLTTFERHLHENVTESILGTKGKSERVLLQARYLTKRYHVVVANPPYMGASNMGPILEGYVSKTFPDSRADLFAPFIERSLSLVRPLGLIAMIAKQNWLFRPSYREFRSSVISQNRLIDVLHLGTGAFDSIGGEIASTAAFMLQSSPSGSALTRFLRLTEVSGEAAKSELFREALAGDKSNTFVRSARDFLGIPGAPLAYWMSEQIMDALTSGQHLGDRLIPREGMSTGDNSKYLRYWFEVSQTQTYRGASTRAEAMASERRWFPYNKGGGPRKWFGHDEYVVDWRTDGQELQTRRHPSGVRIWAHNFNLDYIFQESVSWSAITSKGLALRYYPEGYLFDATGLSAFSTGDRRYFAAAMALCNTPTGSAIADLLNPTHHFKSGDFARLPVPDINLDRANELCERAIRIAHADWNSAEIATEFRGSPLLSNKVSISESIQTCLQASEESTNELLSIEQELNTMVAEAAGTVDGDIPDVLKDAITLRGNADYMFGAGDPSSQMTRSMVMDLISYAVGCIFGRYSLDQDGLLLAGHGDTLQDFLNCVPEPSFIPDTDSVIPITSSEWFSDDIVSRFREFLRIAFGATQLEENLGFIEKSLGEPGKPKALRAYFLKDFYKDHLQRYKKRPIYWMFSTPKSSFNALIYMHRYTPSTVSTVLNEYLREFQAKLQGELQKHERLAVASDGSPRDKTKASKEVDRLRTVLLELDEYEHDILYPLASRQVDLDLDDGVLVNYLRFGRALYRVPEIEKKRAEVVTWDWLSKPLEPFDEGPQ